MPPSSQIFHWFYFICRRRNWFVRLSKYYTEHPIVPLKNIRFLTTDLAGIEKKGIIKL
jgi:hypothetical protein